MANPNSIVTIAITISDASVTKAGFGTPLIMTHEAAYSPDLVRSYSSTTAMVTDGFAAAGDTVTAATQIFAQNPKVTTIKTGIRGTTPSSMTRIMTVASATDSINYTVTLNGTAFTVNSGVGATVASIALALVTAINLGTVPVTATDNSNGTFDLVEDVAGALFGLTHTMNRITQDDTTANAGIATDYAAIKAEDSDFYGVLMTSSATLEIAALAALVEADTKLFVAQTADSDVLADTAGNLGETLNAAGYHRTALVWNMDNFDFANAAWMGRMFPMDPGSATWAFWALSGVTVDVLTDTQIANLQSNKVNFYTNTKGAPFVLDGWAAGGRYLDLTRGIDWFSARTQERLINLLLNSKKIGMTQPGIDSVENEVRAQLAEAYTKTLVTQDYTVTPPALSAVSAADKTARFLDGVNFAATFQGAIQSIGVAGTVSTS